MRKPILIGLLIMLLLCGCSQQTPLESKLKPEATQAIQNEEEAIRAENLEYISSDIKRAVEPYDCTVYVDDKNGNVDVKLFMTGGMTEWIFTECVYSVTDSAHKAIEYYKETLGSIEVSFIIKNPPKGDEVMRWESSDFNTGTLVDSKDKFIRESMSLEELAERYDYKRVIEE